MVKYEVIANVGQRTNITPRDVIDVVMENVKRTLRLGPCCEKTEEWQEMIPYRDAHIRREAGKIEFETTDDRVAKRLDELVVNIASIYAVTVIKEGSYHVVPRE